MTENNVYRLDKKDRKILYELDKNARQSNSQISKKVGLSKETVNYRIKKMESEGLILRYSTIINPFKVGFRKFKLYLRLRNASKQKIEEIGQYFNKHKKTEWVVFASGRWDIVVGYIVKDVNEFDEEMHKVLSRYSNFIQEKAAVTTIYLSHATREFLYGNKEVKDYIYYEVTGKKQEIDGVDDKILKIIANNARISVVDIAEKLKSTPRIIQYKIKGLEKSGVIQGYKVTLDPHKMGNKFYKGIFYLGNNI